MFYIDKEYSNREEIENFDCGHPLFNSYLKVGDHKEYDEDANAVIHYILDVENDALIGYFTLAAASITIFKLSEIINGEYITIRGREIKLKTREIESVVIPDIEIKLKARDEPVIIPAIELKMYAIDKKYQGRMFDENTKLSVKILEAVYDISKYYAWQYIGARMLTLYAIPKVVKMYESGGFKEMPVDSSMYTDMHQFNKGCVPMSKCLFEPIKITKVRQTTEVIEI